ncbi:MAG TPA: DUF4340 domain-containing protein [Mobilitalea sp.]|nr:DUF4340 domain-containing protein [Mobilitalea sp.]
MSKRKKKNRITLISLIGILVILTGFYIWYLNRDKFGKNDETSDEDTSLIMATMDPELIDTIHYKNENADMTFIKENDTWVYVDDKERPIRQNYIQNMINLIDEIKADRIVTENPDDLGQYGLTNPFASIKATQSDGKSIYLLIGNEVTGGSGYYAKLEGNDTVFILPTIYATNLSYSDVNMTQVENGPTITSNNIYHIEVTKKDGEDFELLYDPDSEYHVAGTPLLSWAILKPYEEPYAADSSKVSELLDDFSNFYFLSCVDYKASDFSEYGLDEPLATIFVEYYEEREEELEKPEKDPDTGEEITKKTVREEKSFKLHVGKKDDKGNYYVRKDGDNAVYTMTPSYVDAMLEIDVFNLMSSFVSIHNIENIDRIDIDISGKPYTMEIKREVTTDEEGNEETVATYYYNGKEAEEDVFKDVYQVMIGAKYDTQLKEEVSVEGLQPVLTMTYRYKDTGETYTSKYYPYDESFYLVDTGYPIRFTADKRKIDAIIKAIREFKKSED